MLTKDDLKEIKKLFKPISDKIDDGQIRLEDKISDLYTSIFRLRADSSKEFTSIKRTLKEIRETQNLIIKHFDEKTLDLAKRVDKLESSRAVAHRINK